MRSLFRLVSLRHLKDGKVRTLFTFVGIVLGVAVFVAIRIINRSTLSSFSETVNSVAGRAVLEVSGDETGFDESVLDAIRAVPGVEAAVPSVNAIVYGKPDPGGRGEQGEAEALYLFGVDILQDQAIRNYQVTDVDEDVPDPLVFLSQPKSILITQDYARRQGLSVDAPIQVRGPEGIVGLKVRGLLKPEGPAKVFGGNFAVMDIFGAQRVLGRAGRIDQIDIALKKGIRLETVRAAIAGILPPGLKVDRPATRTAQVEGMLRTFQTLLLLISSISTFVGVFLIYNTVSIAVTQRRREIGILRALGVRRLGILVLFAVEVAFLGVLGGAVGIAVGYGMAKFLAGGVAEAISNYYMQVRVARLVLGRDTLLLGGGLGLAVALFSGLGPAVEAMRVAPTEAMRVGAFQFQKARGFRRGIVIGVLLLVGGPLLMAIQMRSTNPTWGAFSAIVILFGLAFLSPSLIEGGTHLVRPALSRAFGVLGRLAGDNLNRSPFRTAVTVSTLMFGVAMTVAIAGMLDSLRGSIFAWIHQSLTADLFVTAEGKIAGPRTLKIPREIADEVRTLPGVQDLYSLRIMNTEVQGSIAMLITFDLTTYAKHIRPILTEGRLEEVLDRIHSGRDVVLVSETFAARFGAHAGSILTLRTPQGERPFYVGGVDVDYTSDQGTVWLDRSTFDRYWHDSRVDGFNLFIAPGGDAQTIREEIQRRFGDRYHLIIQTQGEFRKDVEGILDETFALAYAMETVSILIAVLGIINTLLVSVIDRIREIGILRAIGTTRSQMRRMVTLEATLMGIGATLLGVVAGGAISVYLVKLAPQAVSGWHLDYSFPAWSSLEMIVLCTLAAALSGLVPAGFAASLDLRKALEYE